MLSQDHDVVRYVSTEPTTRASSHSVSARGSNPTPSAPFFQNNRGGGEISKEQESNQQSRERKGESNLGSGVTTTIETRAPMLHRMQFLENSSVTLVPSLVLRHPPPSSPDLSFPLPVSLRRRNKASSPGTL